LPKFDEYVGKFDIVVYGHTHYQYSCTYRSLCIINPGSVGQPRSGILGGDRGYARAQWAVYDTSSRTCQHQTTHYDVTSLLQQIAENDPGMKSLNSVFLRY
jgi:predicted phosphodiesterase